MPLSNETRDAVRNVLTSQVRRYIDEGRAQANPRELKPFHARLLPALFDIPLSERSFSTRSGGWWQRLAQIIASQFHAQAVIGYRLDGHIKPAAAQHVDEIIRQLNIPGARKPLRTQDIAEVLTVQSPNGDTTTAFIDLYVQEHSGHELFFEMKTATPNKDTSIAMKRGILRISAMCKGRDAEAFAAIAYNPYGDGKPYTWNYALQFLEVGQDLMVGRQFWERIGDKTTYEELLEITDEVGRDLESIAANAIDEYRRRER